MTMDPDREGDTKEDVVVSQVPEIWGTHELRILYLLGGLIVFRLRKNGKLSDKDHELHSVSPKVIIQEIERVGEDITIEEIAGKAISYKFMGLSINDQHLLAMSMMAFFSCYGVEHFTPHEDLTKRKVMNNG